MFSYVFNPEQLCVHIDFFEYPRAAGPLLAVLDDMPLEHRASRLWLTKTAECGDSVSRGRAFCWCG